MAHEGRIVQRNGRQSLPDVRKANPGLGLGDGVKRWRETLSVAEKAKLKRQVAETIERRRRAQRAALNPNVIEIAVLAAGLRLGADGEFLGQCVVAVAKHLRVTRQTIYTWIKDGHMNKTALSLARGLAEASGMPVETFGAPIARAPQAN
jgi:hypothetical protein